MFKTVSISTKLLAANALICVVFVFIGLAVVLSFYHIGEMVKDVLLDDLGEVANNALTERELSSILADTDLLLNTFYENGERLKTDGNRLLTLTLVLAGRNKGRDLERPFRVFEKRLGFLLRQCGQVNVSLARMNDMNRAIAEGIDNLEITVSNELIQSAFGGRDTSISEHLAGLVADLRLILLQIGRIHAESWPQQYYTVPSRVDRVLIPLTEDLVSRTQVLTASDFESVVSGRDLPEVLEDYAGTQKALHHAMVELKARKGKVEDAARQIRMVMDRLDRDVFQATDAVCAKIDRSFYTTGVAGLLLFVFLVVFLGLSTALFFKKIIKTPMEAIREGIGNFSAGNLDARIGLNRRDEWQIIENALNTMASRLSASHADLKKAHDELEAKVLERTFELTSAKEKAEAANRELQFMAYALDHAADAAFWMKKGTPHFIHVNETACKILGYTKDELLSMEPGHDNAAPNPLRVDLPENRATQTKKMLEDFQEKVRAAGCINLESAYRARNGVEIPVEISIYHAEFAGEDFFISYARDITERKAAEKQLKKAMEDAEAANRAKSIFIANMSHELRTPLSVILGYSNLMQRDASLPPKQREHLGIINRSGRHLLALINDVLEISKIEAGRSALEIATFDLRSLFREIADMFDSGMHAKGLRFEIIGIEIIPRHVAADEKKLRQVLINLLGNAVKFTEHGGISMGVAVEDGKPGRMRLKVEVADTGMGIAGDESDRVFGRFEQTVAGRAKKSGTGLGLAICREYIRMMGGDITVASQEGKGSTFRFQIEIGEVRGSDIKERRAPRRRVIGLEPDREAPRVLVADDMDAGRDLLAQLLKSVGFQVREAADGKRAVDIFHEWRPDFVWMDIDMPVMDGLEATLRIRETENGKSTAVAALTAHALEEERPSVLAAGFTDLVYRPFQERDIFEVMKRHLGVNYIYKEEKREEAGENIPGLSAGQLAALPADLLRKLHRAVVEVDQVRALALIEQIAGHDAAIGNALLALAKSLDYGRLLSLLTGHE